MDEWIEAWRALAVYVGMADPALSTLELKARLRLSTKFQGYSDDEDQRKAARIAASILVDILRGRGVSEIDIDAAANLPWSEDY